jgi:hypothetical protein
LTAPALAPATSLDTGQYFDTSDTSKRPELDLRLYRADAAKVALSRFLSDAARRVYDDRPADAVALDKMASQLEGCRHGGAARDAVCGAYTFRPNSCHVRLCPDCERARSSRLVARYDEIGSQMATPRLWTLTLPNVAPGELRAGLAVLLDSIAHLRRRAIVAGGPCHNAHRAVAYDDVDRAEHHASGDELDSCAHPPHRRELSRVGSCRCARCVEVTVERAGHRVTVNGCPRCIHEAVRGGVYSIEVTWSPERYDWHPHVHILMDAPWIAWSEVRDAWRAVTCDAIRRAERRLPNKVRVNELAGGARSLTKCEHRADSRGIATSGCRGASIVWVNNVEGEPGSPERRKAVRETLKYVSKGLLDHNGHLLPGVSALELAELLLAIRGRRLVAGWGSFRNVHDDEEDGLDPALFLVGPDVPPGLVGMPLICPCCHALALWELPIRVRRTACQRLPDGALVWRPPDRFVS